MNFDIKHSIPNINLYRSHQGSLFMVEKKLFLTIDCGTEAHCET